MGLSKKRLTKEVIEALGVSHTSLSDITVDDHHNDIHTLNHHSTPYELDNDLTLDENLYLDETTYANLKGIVYKNSIPFIHDFSYGFNGTTTPAGRNVFIGENAGNLTTGQTATVSEQSSYNTAIGYETLKSVTTGYQNTAIGYYSLHDNNIGYRNTAIGYRSLDWNCSGYDNVAIGWQALRKNVNGYHNTGIGTDALYSNWSGISNTGIGWGSLYLNSGGNENTGIGDKSLFKCNGSENLGIGANALYDLTTGIENMGMGSRVLYALTTGSENIGLGSRAGHETVVGNNTSSVKCIFIGARTKPLANGDSNEIVIGDRSVGKGTNTTQIGNTNTTDTYIEGTVDVEDLNVAGNVGIGTTSPDYPLEVEKASDPYITSKDSTLGNYAAFTAAGTLSAYPRAAFRIGSGGALSNVGMWITPDSTSQSPTFMEIMTSTDTGTLNTKRLSVYQSTTLALIQASAKAGNDTGTDLCIYVKGNDNQLYLKNNGNIGISTNAPTEKLDINSDAIRIRSPQTPASAGAAGNQGDICWDSDYIYVCTATNTWKRTAISTW